MNLKHNLIANYVSQIYTTAVGIFMVPLYIKYMGPEAYGLVGFFTMLQAWFNLLDMGLSHTMSRESARFNGGAITALEYRRLARALEVIFAAIALIGGGVLLALAEPMAIHWLNVKELTIAETVTSLRLIAVIVALRWVCGLYRGVITGAERLVWLAGLNSGIATFRFLLVLPLLVFVSQTPMAFFVFQLLVALIELFALAFVAYRLLPAVQIGERILWQLKPLKPVLKFALSIAFTSSVWILVTQSDKLVLSKIMLLSDYGYFTVAMLLANGIMIVSGPISSVIMPRMARLHAEGQNYQLLALYRESTLMVTMTAVPVAMLLAFFAPQLLWLWSGNPILVEKTSTTLTLYSIGYGILVVGAFPYYLQYAFGDLKMHIWGNLIYVVFLVPLMIWAAVNFGMVGAGWSWLISNLIYFLLWTPLVHVRFAPGIHFKWLVSDVFIPVLPIGFILTLFFYFIPWSVDRKILFFQFLFIGIFLVFSQYFIFLKFRILNILR